MRRSSWPLLPPRSGCTEERCVASARISGAFHVFLLIRTLDTALCSLANFTGALTQDLESTGRVGPLLLLGMGRGMWYLRR